MSHLGQGLSPLPDLGPSKQDGPILQLVLCEGYDGAGSDTSIELLQLFGTRFEKMPGHDGGNEKNSNIQTIY